MCSWMAIKSDAEKWSAIKNWQCTFVFQYRIFFFKCYCLAPFMEIYSSECEKTISSLSVFIVILYPLFYGKMTLFVCFVALLGFVWFSLFVLLIYNTSVISAWPSLTY